MTDTVETRATKLKGGRNGALSIKVPPSKTRERQSGGAQVNNTRTDYLISSTFGTNHNIIMHGLRNLRATDQIKINYSCYYGGSSDGIQTRINLQTHGISEPQESLMF